MAEGGGAEGEDGRAHLGIRNDLDAEDVGEARAAVVAEGAENEVLALLVEDEDAGEHGGGGWQRVTAAAAGQGSNCCVDSPSPSVLSVRAGVGKARKLGPRAAKAATLPGVG